MTRIVKPRHLSPEQASQYEDLGVVAAYANRPPYPEEVFEALASLLPSGRGRVLELGSGTGDLTLRLAARVEGIDAVERSRPMIERARQRAGPSSTNIRWIHAAAEDFAATDRYALVVAAESIHWMDWVAVIRMIARSLEDGGVLAIVADRAIDGLPWLSEARKIIAEHSTNREYVPYDIVQELSRHGLFREAGRRYCRQPGFSQDVDAFVESCHSRNGLSRERMSSESAARFDEAMRGLVLAHVPDGVVSGAITSTVVWGQPLTTVATR